MAGREDMIKKMESLLGTVGRPNEATRWYAARNGSYFASAAWCNMTITWAAYHSGNYDAVCFNKDYAYTVWHAQRFQQAGQWYTDTAGIRRGDIVFFDWGGTNSVSYIDHVGIVTDVNGRDILTIEGNTDDRCARRVRHADTIVGYGRPKYKEAATAVTYTVKAGDTLSSIGTSLGVDWAAIASLNGIRGPYVIHVGQELRIPVTGTPAPSPVPTPATVADKIRALAAGGTKVGGPFSKGNTSPVTVYGKSGLVYFTSGMSIDCDGQPGSKCNPTSDPTFQPQTAFKQSDGQYLKAEELPFAVLPLSGAGIWNYRDQGIEGGDLVAMAYGDKHVFGVVGDLGPADRIGEGSYAAAEALGINPDPRVGGVASGVTYVVFPGVRVSPIESAAEAVRLGEAKLSGTAPEPEPTPTPEPEPTPEPPPPPPAYTPPPFPTGLRPNSSSPSAKPLQTALKKAGYLANNVTLADNYGPATQAAVKKFYVANASHGWSPDIAIGPLGWAELHREAYGGSVTPTPTPTPSDGEPAHDYKRVTYGGKTVNTRTKVMLENAVKLLTAYEWAPFLTQGSYNTGVGASAGTHDGGGVVDIRTSTMSATGVNSCLKALRQAGFAAWYRTSAEGFSPHIHAVAIGDREMSPAAKSQVVQYFAGKNGLANQGPDTAPASVGRPYPTWAAKYK